MSTKLTSRKFWVAVIGFVSQLLYCFKVADSDVQRVSTLIMAGATLIAYIIGEGLSDSCDKTYQTYESNFPMNPPMTEKESEYSTTVEITDLTGYHDIKNVSRETLNLKLDERLTLLEARVDNLEDEWEGLGGYHE